MWSEISRGKLHVICPVPDTLSSEAFSVVLPKTAQEYFTFYNYDKYRADSAIHHDIWAGITSQGLTDWRPFDRWKKVDSLFYYTPIGQGDGYVDMIYKVMKSRGAKVQYSNGVWTTIFADYAGYALLGTNYFSDTQVDAFGTKINYSGGQFGSGLTVSYRAQLSQYIGTMGHEHGHYLFSLGHSTYSRVSYGFGYDFFFSPADMILNRYMTPTNANINATNLLGDFSSRNSGSGNLLKIPVQGNEYFLLASRNKVSKWDRVMSGDVAQIDQYGDESEYGKGLYIYHVRDGLNFPGGDISQQDMECADGLFEFEYGGQAAQQVVHDCFTSGANAWYYYNKKKVIYENDSSNLFLEAPPAGHTNIPKGDGISFRWYWGFIPPDRYIYHIKWWGEGEQPGNPCNIGTDRLFTNNEEAYTRFDVGGDKYDPWKPGYNEVFSPYSSPNTNTWTTNPHNQNSGIFIWYFSYSGSTPANTAYIKIYKAGEGGFSEDSILHLTPPSRPMGLRILSCDSTPTISGFPRIKLRWYHNMESDMEVNGSKKYKIYCDTAVNTGFVPYDAMQYPQNYYQHIATVNIAANSIPEYTDSLKISTCYNGGVNYSKYPVRYRVQAVDKYNDESVLSDFAKTEAWTTINGGQGSDNMSINETISTPRDYFLKQNYPNPFNPTTRISYGIPKEGFVTLKIYDILGKEVMTLVNGNMQAGYYDAEFNGNNLASGLYFYTIKSDNFTETKRMLLIK